MKRTKMTAYVAIGIALYVCLSMTAKIPVIGHIGLDLGYIALACTISSLFVQTTSRSTW